MRSVLASWIIVLCAWTGCSDGLMEDVTATADFFPASDSIGQPVGDAGATDAGDATGETIGGRRTNAETEIEEEPEPAPPKLIGTIKVMTFNIEHGGLLGTKLDDIAEVIKAQNPDLVGLNEVQHLMPDSGFKKEAEELASKTGLTNQFFGCTTNCGAITAGRYGVAILSRYDLTNRDKLFLPNQTNGSVNLTSSIEPRVLLCGAMHGGNFPVVRFCTTHLTNSDTEASKQIRALQAQAIVKQLEGEMGPYGGRIILTGDMNTTPGTQPINTLTSLLDDSWPQAGAGPGATMPSDAPSVRWDYILHSKKLGPAKSAVVIDTRASDHRPLVVTVPVYDEP